MGIIKVDTKAYGLVEVDERQTIQFPSGLYGFENLTDYILMDAPQNPFYWLQSLEVKHVAFVLVDPRIIRSDYDCAIDSVDFRSLDLQGPSDERLLQFAIVTIPENRSDMTVNLQGPIIINKDNRKGRQCISQDDSLRVRHNIMEEMTASSKNAC